MRRAALTWLYWSLILAVCVSILVAVGILVQLRTHQTDLGVFTSTRPLVASLATPAAGEYKLILDRTESSFGIDDKPKPVQAQLQVHLTGSRTHCVRAYVFPTAIDYPIMILWAGQVKQHERLDLKLSLEQVSPVQHVSLGRIKWGTFHSIASLADELAILRFMTMTLFSALFLCVAILVGRRLRAQGS
jgi:hypothetical protein